MKKKVNTKIQKKLDNIIKLKSELENWKKLSEEEVLKYVKEFEKTPRDEGSSFYDEYFNDSKFADILIDIAKVHSKNQKTVINIVSALGNMMWRYKLPETDAIYQLMIDNSQQKGIAPYVAIYLPAMNMFKDFQDKWGYYMSIKKMSPKKIAESEFLDIIEDKLKDIPSGYKKDVIDFLENKIQRSNSDYSKNRYSEMIESINS